MISFPKGTILLIEDDKRFQENLSVIFRVAGYEALFAPTAEEGFQFLESKQVDLMILDYNLPGMDGMEFLNRFMNDKKYDNLRWLPVIVMTGYPITLKEKEEFIQLGAKSIIAKGTGFKDLVRTIDHEVEIFKSITNFDHEYRPRLSLPDYLAHIEKQIILRALIRNSNASHEMIALELGIPRSTLSRKIGEYKLKLD